MANLIIVAILAVILFAAIRYIYKAKKSGAKCIGCSVEGGCAQKGGGCGCGCGSNEETSSCGCGCGGK